LGKARPNNLNLRRLLVGRRKIDNPMIPVSFTVSQETAHAMSELFAVLYRTYGDLRSRSDCINWLLEERLIQACRQYGIATPQDRARKGLPALRSERPHRGEPEASKRNLKAFPSPHTDRALALAPRSQTLFETLDAESTAQPLVAVTNVRPSVSETALEPTSTTYDFPFEQIPKEWRKVPTSTLPPKAMMLEHVRKGRAKKESFYENFYLIPEESRREACAKLEEEISRLYPTPDDWDENEYPDV
jgi:hypothetical protein